MPTVLNRNPYGPGDMGESPIAHIAIKTGVHGEIQPTVIVEIEPSGRHMAERRGIWQAGTSIPVRKRTITIVNI